MSNQYEMCNQCGLYTCDCAKYKKSYQQGFEDGKKEVCSQREAYMRGFDDGKREALKDFKATCSAMLYNVQANTNSGEIFKLELKKFISRVFKIIEPPKEQES